LRTTLVVDIFTFVFFIPQELASGADAAKLKMSRRAPRWETKKKMTWSRIKRLIMTNTRKRTRKSKHSNKSNKTAQVFSKASSELRIY
jgi:hypothetical protein